MLIIPDEVVTGALIDAIAVVGRQISKVASGLRKPDEDLATARWFETFRLTGALPDQPDLSLASKDRLAEVLSGAEIQAALQELLAARLTDAPETDASQARDAVRAAVTTADPDAAAFAGVLADYYDDQICGLVARLEAEEPPLLAQIRSEAFSSRIISILHAIERHTAALADDERRPSDGHSGSDLTGRLISDWSPVALGVHPSIGGSLPAYVMRQHDILLRAAVHPGSAVNRLIVLRGGSSTGKSRSAFEAVRAQLTTWRVDYPRSVGVLVQRLDSGVRPQTVLWLGELRGYAQSRAGQDALARLGDLLGQAGEVIVITTVWPEFWDRYTRDPDPETPEPSTGLRDLLQALPQLSDASEAEDVDPAAGGVLDVPDKFTSADLGRAHDLVRRTRDVALQEVIEVAAHAGAADEIAQYSAGAADLLSHYDGPGADPYGRALITAAMDASRLGLSAPFPLRVLTRSAEGYLTGRQRATAPRGWQYAAIGYASRPLRGALHALEPVPPKRGFGVAGYRLADYLDQYGRQQRGSLLVPPQLWDALAAEVSGAEERLRLAHEAEARGLNRLATQLAASAVEAGDAEAMQLIARQWIRMGSMTKAIAWYRTSIAADPGDGSAAGRLADLIEQLGDEEEADRLRAAARPPETLARTITAILRGTRATAGEDESRRRAEAGDATAMLSLGDLLHADGKDDEAARWYERTTRSGQQEGVWKLADLLEGQGKDDQAAALLRTYAEAGNREAMWRLHELLDRHGHAEEAFTWIQRQADLGNPVALVLLGSRLLHEGAEEEAERLYRVWAEEKAEPAAMWYLAELLARTGRLPEAITWFQRSYQDSMFGMNALVDRLEELGCIEAAEAPLQARADKGDPAALDHLARLFERLGRNDQAERVHRLLTELGHPDRARFPQRPGYDERSSAIAEFSAFLERIGRGAEAEQVRKFGIIPGGLTAKPWDPPAP
jgi:tetratricopeptide (TPR) repeat protein